MKKNFEALEGGSIMKAAQDASDFATSGSGHPWKAKNMPDRHGDRLQGFILTLF
jgi:hypothetical protein